ncbi:MAG: hypothetical protein IJ565_01815 [Bacilli bacterium]|nr:hypothetical protein [Bacilli bacterium]
MKNFSFNESIFEKLIQETKEGRMNIKLRTERLNYPLIGEFEAMYFKSIRNFFENSISHLIMEHNQDIYDGEFIENKRR